MSGALTWDPARPGGSFVDDGRSGLPAFPASSAANLLPYCTKAQWAYTDVSTGAFGSDYTQHVQMAMEAPFDAIQVGVLNGYSAGGTVVQVIASVMAAAGDPTTTAPLNNAGTWVNAGVGGSALNVPAASTNAYAPGIAWGDVVQLSSLDRSDGGTLPLLCVRVQSALASNGGVTNRITSMVPCTIANPAFEADNANSVPYGRIYRSRNNAVLGVTTPSLMTTTSNGNGNAAPIIVRYWLRNGYGRTLVVIGDSIPGAYGSTSLNGWSFAHEARRQVSTPLAPVDLAVLCFSGSGSNNTAVRAEALAVNFKGASAFSQIASPNSIGVPISAAGVASERFNFQRILNACSAQSMPVIAWTMFPAQYSAKSWGATDTLRTAMNATRLAGSRSTATVVDFGGAAAGPVDANGQQTFPGSEADGLHPTAATQISLASLLAQYLK